MWNTVKSSNNSHVSCTHFHRSIMMYSLIYRPIIPSWSPEARWDTCSQKNFGSAARQNCCLAPLRPNLPPTSCSYVRAFIEAEFIDSKRYAAARALLTLLFSPGGSYKERRPEELKNNNNTASRAWKVSPPSSTQNSPNFLFPPSLTHRPPFPLGWPLPPGRLLDETCGA